MKTVNVMDKNLATLSADELHCARLQDNGVDLPQNAKIIVGNMTVLTTYKPGHNLVFGGDENWTTNW